MNPMTVRNPAGKTIADWLAQPEDARLELIDGELIHKPGATMSHGSAHAAVAQFLGVFDRKEAVSGRPGGWWIAMSVDVAMGEQVFLPDVVGWRRETTPVMASQRAVTVRPDWICEIVSESNRAHDTVKKLRRYHQSGVPHYWILDQVERTLTVHRHGEGGYLIALRAEAHETVRAEPFDAIELRVGLLLGDDPD